MQIHTVVVDGPLALRMRRLDAARESATGRQILTLPLLAARIAGGFVLPASHEILYLARRQALEAGGYEDTDKVSQLPGMPAAVLSALRDLWDMEVPASFPDNARLRDFALLERRVRGALPSGMLTPLDLVKAAMARLRFAPKLVGVITIQDIPDIQAVWRPLIQALCEIVPVRWIASQHSRRAWFAGETATRSSGAALLGSADLCADPRNEVREALRWARACGGRKSRSPRARHFGRLAVGLGRCVSGYLARGGNACSFHARYSSASNPRRTGLRCTRRHPVTRTVAGTREAPVCPAAA